MHSMNILDNTLFTNYLDDLEKRLPSLGPSRSSLAAAADLLVMAFDGGSKLLVCGNGGSAADSEHIVGELMKGFVRRRRLDSDSQDMLMEIDPELGEVLSAGLQEALPAIALTGHLSLRTAVSNDNGGDLPFAQQVWGYGRPGDVLWAISTSGNSRSVLLAAVAAKARGMSVLAMTGCEGGRLAKLADVCIRAPSSETYRAQEEHMAIYHTLCLAIEHRFFPG